MTDEHKDNLEKMAKGKLNLLECRAVAELILADEIFNRIQQQVSVEPVVMLNFAKELEEKIKKTNKGIEDTCDFDAHGDIKHAQLYGRLKCLEEILIDIKSKISA